jgi:hypothetical protein
MKITPTGYWSIDITTDNEAEVFWLSHAIAAILEDAFSKHGKTYQLHEEPISIITGEWESDTEELSLQEIFDDVTSMTDIPTLVDFEKECTDRLLMSTTGLLQFTIHIGELVL